MPDSFETVSEERDTPVDLVYELAIESYGLAQARFMHLDNGIQALMALALQATLLFAIAVRAFNLTLAIWPLALAVIVFLMLIATGIQARFFSGGFTVIDPYRLHRGYLDTSAREFKEDVIHFAGKHLAESSSVAQGRKTSLQFMSLLFFFEIVFLLLSALLAFPGT